MATIDTLGLQNFPTWPLSAWEFDTSGSSGNFTVSGGVEGLSIHTVVQTPSAVNSVASYDARGCSVVWRFPSSEGAGTHLGCWVIPDGSFNAYGWEWNDSLSEFRAFAGSDVVFTEPLSSTDRYFRLDMPVGSAVYYSSPDGVSWSLWGTTSVSDVWSSVTLQIGDSPEQDNQTAGLTSLQARTIASYADDAPLTLGNAKDLFRQWLDTVDYTQSHSSAVLTYQQVQAQTTGYAGTYGGLTLSGDSLKQAILAIVGFIGSMLSILGFLQDLFPEGHTPTDHDANLQAHRDATEPEGETLPAFIEAENSTLLDAIIAQTDELTQILAHGNGTEDIPTIVGESDWSGTFRFDVAADFYVVDITSVWDDAGAEDLAGDTSYTHIGFAVPLTIDGLPEYGPRLALSTQVIRTGRQMGGIILSGSGVLSAHIRAYQYLAP